MRALGEKMGESVWKKLPEIATGLGLSAFETESEEGSPFERCLHDRLPAELTGQWWQKRIHHVQQWKLKEERRSSFEYTLSPYSNPVYPLSLLLLVLQREDEKMSLQTS